MPKSRIAIGALALTLALTFGCAPAENAPKAVLGELDLSHWDFEGQGSVFLAGDWSICWSELVEPDESECRSGKDGAWSTVPVPGLWSEEAVPSPFGGRGFATYRLRIHLPPGSSPVFLRAGAPHAAYRTYIDGVPRGGAGTVGRTPDTATPLQRNRVYDLPRERSSVLLQVDVSNFDFRGGGLRRPWLLGTPDQIQSWVGRGILREALLAIVAGLVGLAFLLQFALRPAERARGYFGLFGLVIGLRAVPASISDFSQLLLPAASYVLLLRMEYLGTALAIFAGAGFFRSRVPDVMPPRLVWLIQLSALAVAFIALVAPVPLVLETIFVILGLPALIMAVVILSYGRAYRRGVAGTGAVLLGSLVFLPAVGHDIVRTQFGLGLPLELFPYLFIVWLLSESTGMLRTFFESFSNVEALSGQLQDSNLELQETESAVVRFVPVDLLRLLGKPSIDKIEPGDRVEATMTVLFCRVHPAPGASADRVFQVLGDLLQRIEPTLQHGGGYVSHQSVGSLIVLFPGRADEAVHAAQEVDRAVRDAARRLEARVGIGIATGPIVIGTIGSPQQLVGSVVGQPVEVAQRIEALTGDYAVDLLIAESTRNALDPGSDLELREIGTAVLAPGGAPVRLNSIV